LYSISLMVSFACAWTVAQIASHSQSNRKHFLSKSRQFIIAPRYRYQIYSLLINRQMVIRL
jgi:hypothetical protein